MRAVESEPPHSSESRCVALRGCLGHWRPSFREGHEGEDPLRHSFVDMDVF